MPCLIALLVLGVLSVFSASHRQLAREAFDCVFRRVRLRPCDTGFDVKVKAKVLGPILSRSPKTARFVSRHFEGLAWLLMLLTSVSLIWTMRGLYNFWAWGDCNGQFASGSFCVFDPAGTNNQATGADGAECTDQGLASRALSLEGVETDGWPTLKAGKAELPGVFFIGCYSCDFTRKAYPILKRVFAGLEPTVRFAHYPTKEDTKYLLSYDVCVEQLAPDRVSEYVDWLLTQPKEVVSREEAVKTQLESWGIAATVLNQCLANEETSLIVTDRQRDLNKVGVYGTPTVFIGGEALVGPKPERVYRRLLSDYTF